MKCFACDRPLAGEGFHVDTRDDQIVSVGSDCYTEVLACGGEGWQPPKGGPRLYPMPKVEMRWSLERTLEDAEVELYDKETPAVEYGINLESDRPLYITVRKTPSTTSPK